MPAPVGVRRLPGVRFEAQPPPPPLVLPRMDVAVLVGFAAGGPVNVPVPVEDVASYAAIFGPDVELAWDDVRGEPCNAHLGGAVRSFFANGGRRCYVVRVARQPKTLAFELPSLLVRNRAGLFRRATLAARSPGTWADDLDVSVALESRIGSVVDSGSLLSFDVRGLAPTVGDVLRFTGPGPALAAAVAGTASPAAGVTTVALDRDTTVWLSEAQPLGSGTARFTGFDGSFQTDVPAAGDGASLLLAVSPEAAPAPGAVVVVEDFGVRTYAFRVRSVAARSGGVAVEGVGAFVGTEAPLGAQPPTIVEQLTVELRARRRASGETFVLSGLGLAPAHPRWLGSLPNDVQLFDPDAPRTALARDVATPRFPLAGWRLHADEICIPLDLTPVHDAFLGPRRPLGTPQRRNGLLQLDERLFLDPALQGARVASLEGIADAVRWTSPRPRRLRGVHAAYALEEATLLAAPDAVHRPWTDAEQPPPPPPAAPTAREHPDLSGFAECGLRILPAPVLHDPDVDGTGGIVLAWDPTDDPDAEYVVEEATDPAFDGAEVVFEGRGERLELYGRPQGAFYYRVYARSGSSESDWSQPIVVSVAPPVRSVLGPPDPRVLLSVQRAALRVAAARGDILCAFALPGDAREDAAADHAAAIAAPATSADATLLVPPLDESERSALSYGALYHPWLLGRASAGPVDRVPPDGAALGLLAKRARTRGAWVAPANVPLAGVAALEPQLPRSALARLQDAQVNVVRAEPAGFLTLAQDTLLDDADLRPINVRRLLSLLRRLALLHGPRWVFEPNGPALRRSVQRGFEALLGAMFELGAFAGKTRDDSFRVELPPQRDAAQLVVELKVAPSRPLAFVTVRLVAAGDGTLRVVLA